MYKFKVTKYEAFMNKYYIWLDRAKASNGKFEMYIASRYKDKADNLTLEQAASKLERMYQLSI